VLGLYYKDVLKQDWIEHVIDVETAFLHAKRLNSDKKTYIKVPSGFEELMGIKTGTDDVIELTGVLYGEVDAPLAWAITFKKILTKIGFKQSLIDPCLYIMQDKKMTLEALMMVHVDNCKITGSRKKVMWTEKEIKKHVPIKDLGELRKFLGVNYKAGTDKIGPISEST
jgi:hypothetical protein